MSAKSSIEWTDASWTPIRARNKTTGKVGWHCEHVSPGCAHCYSDRQNRWIGTGLHYKPTHRDDVENFLDEKILTQPLRWREPRRIFVCSMTDLFADFVTDEMIAAVFGVMAAAPRHTFQVLTKRPERMLRWFQWAGSQEGGRLSGAWMACHKAAADASNAYEPAPGANDTWPLPNVMMGVSVEDQQRADERVPLLAQAPAAVKFLSVEPLLSPVDLGGYYLSQRCGYTATVGRSSARYPFEKELPGETYRTTWAGMVDLVIVGAESGPGARPMDLEWVRTLRDQCVAAGTKFFLKQFADARGRKMPLPLLDGRQWAELPAVAR